MAVRARPDNLSLEEPSVRPAPGDAGHWFAELWGHHQELQAVCLRMVGDPGKAEDLVQETYLRALQQSRRLDRRDSFGPWLATVARRRAIDEIRARQRNREQPAVLDLRATATAASDDPAEQVLQQELFDRIRVAMRELTTRERQLLLRQVTHGLTLAELAEEEDTSIASVRSVLSRARVKLRSALERGGPLGALPGTKLVAGLRERLQRVAAKVEGAMPSFAAGGAHLGDMVGAAIAAAIMLLGGATVPAPSDGPSVDIAAAQAAGATGATIDGTARAGAPTTGGNARVDAELSTSAGATPAPAPLPPPINPLPPGVDPPWLPQDGTTQPEGAAIDHLAASSDGSVVYASGLSAKQDFGAIFRSTDYGRSWQRAAAVRNLSGPVLVPASYPAQPRLFALSLGVLLQSDDHAETFHPEGGAGNIAAPSPHFGSGDETVFVGLPAATLGQYDTRSRVTTARRRQPSTASNIGSIAFLASYPQGESILLGTQVLTPRGYLGTVHRCDEERCTQSAALDGISMAPLLSVSKATPTTVFAAVVNGLFRSDDEAQTFTRLPVPNNLRIDNIAEGYAGELFLFGSNAPGKKAASGIFRSTDRGHTWTPLGVGSPLEQGVTSVVRLPNGNVLAATGSMNRGMFCSADDGATWARRCT